MSISDPENDTRIRPSINTLETLQALSKFGPFQQLAAFVESSCHKDGLHDSEADNIIGYELDSTVNSTLENNANCLNSIMRKFHNRPSIQFTDYEQFESDSRYYEQIIYESSRVPTRRNWHDFFNGLIWSQFPKTKQYFNKAHIQQILLTGNVKKRTPVRDKLTHFDECGLVLFTNCVEVQAQLKEHQWKTLFVDEAPKWHSTILPVIFGHALWEMLLDPFIGLTAKVTVINVSDIVITQLKSAKNDRHLFAKCDNLLLDHISNNQLIDTQRPWLPLPLLGIPQWSPFEQTALFYSNERYFMPKRK
ncbi:MAG: hypothetical protein ACJAVV_003700 [Alphaproteobacteria bacterium]|jgi:hypothetical protein